ncbi:MAG: PadR family transcriptional regulator [Firmicutes bacterium]|nr:PadR family transcriptional regulator [Bacillota bacterium]
MVEISRQLKKGVIETLVLKLLSQNDMYGYEIIQELDKQSGGVFSLKEGTLYPVLYRLEDSKFIEPYWQDVGGKRGVPRKYYRVTEAGLHELDRIVGEWETLNNSVNKILHGGS